MTSPLVTELDCRPGRFYLDDLPDDLRFAIGITLSRARGGAAPGVEMGLFVTYFDNKADFQVNTRLSIAASIYKRATPDDIDARAAAVCMERVKVPEGVVLAIVNDSTELFRVELYEENS